MEETDGETMNSEEDEEMPDEGSDNGMDMFDEGLQPES